MKIYKAIMSIIISACIFSSAVSGGKKPKTKRSISYIPTDYFLGIPCSEHQVVKEIIYNIDGSITKKITCDLNNKKTRLEGYLVNSGLALLSICFFYYIMLEYSKLPITNQ